MTISMNITFTISFLIIINLFSVLVYCDAAAFECGCRIIGGWNAAIEHFPFMAQIILNFAAAHCLRDVEDFLEDDLVRIRSNTSYWQNETNEFTVIRLINKYIIHESYEGEETFHDYDVGLIKVETPFNGINEKVYPFANKDYVYVQNSIAEVVGWGTTDPKQQTPSETLKQAKVFITDFHKCGKAYRKYTNQDELSERMLCAKASGVDACSGDSGGPLIQNNTIIGIISWGIECNSDIYDGIYSRVSKFSTWIGKHISEKK